MSMSNLTRDRRIQSKYEFYGNVASSFFKVDAFPPDFIFETWFGCTIVNSETILCPHLHRPVFNITLKKKLLCYFLFNPLRLRISFFQGSQGQDRQQQIQNAVTKLHN